MKKTIFRRHIKSKTRISDEKAILCVTPTPSVRLLVHFNTKNRREDANVFGKEITDLLRKYGFTDEAVKR